MYTWDDLTGIGTSQGYENQRPRWMLSGNFIILCGETNYHESVQLADEFPKFLPLNGGANDIDGLIVSWCGCGEMSPI